METFKKTIAKRAAPGVLILDLEDRLLYTNPEALEMLFVLQESDRGQNVPREVYDLCRELKDRTKRAGAVSCVIRHPGSCDQTEVNCSIRAFLMDDSREGSNSSHVLVMIEKITISRQVNVEKAREEFKLSLRETEVVRLICKGLANKEISNAIFISEFTVKDHIKKIMQKMGTGSRNGIMAALL